MGTKIAGPGRLGSMKAVKQSLKKKGSASIKIIPKENSITVRFLDEPEDWHGYYEHYVDGDYRPCVTDECPGCESDDPEEQRKIFRYLANAYVVDDQKVWAVKMPKSMVETLVQFYTKYKGTIRDRDYELARTGSGQNDTKYTALPDAPSSIKMSRFDSKKFDLGGILQAMVDGDVAEDEDEDDEPVKSKKKGKKSKKSDPWEDVKEDEPVKKKKSASRTVAKKKTSTGTVKKKRTVKR